MTNILLEVNTKPDSTIIARKTGMLAIAVCSEMGYLYFFNIYCRKTDVINNHQPHSLDAIPSNTEHHAATVRAGTIHFQLSAHNNPQPPYQQQEDKPVAEEAEEDTGSQAQAPLSPSLSVGAYSGPDCYVKPKGKSNLQIIRNAICAVCLAGTVNMSLKQKTLVVSVYHLHVQQQLACSAIIVCFFFVLLIFIQEIDKSSATHVVILFRDTVGFKFRGIYSYNSGDRHVSIEETSSHPVH